MTEKQNDLGKKIVKGTFWIVALEIANQALQFVKTFYAARLLTPADFGIVGFAFLIIAFLEIISTTGMKEAIIQRSDDLTSYLDTVWLTEFAKGAVVLILTWFLAPIFTGYFASANAQLTTDVVRFIGAIYFLLCSTSIGAVYFEKNLEFNKFFIYQFAGTLVDVGLSLTLVYYWQNVWALFYGVLAGAITRVIFSFALTSYRPGLQWSKAKARELLQYGKWIFKTRVFSFFALQSDSIIVSSFYSITSLGIYQMAFRIGNLPMSQVTNIVGRLAFQTFAKLQDEPEKLRAYFLNSIGIFTALFAPVILLIFCLIPEFTTLLLGEKWIAIVPVVRALILAGFVRIYASLLESYFSAIGKPKESSNLQQLRFLSFIAVVAPMGYWLGINGVALSALLSLTVVLVVYTPRAGKMLRFSLGDILHVAGFPVLFAVTAGAAVFALKTQVDGTTYVGFAILVASALGLYILEAWLMDKYTQVKIFSKTVSLVKNFRNGSSS